MTPNAFTVGRTIRNLAAGLALLVGFSAFMPARAADPPKPADQAREFDEFIRGLYKIQSPAIALQVIDEFEISHDLTPQQQNSLKTQRDRFRDLDRQGLVKLGPKWVKPAERDAAIQKYKEELKFLVEAVGKGDGKEVLRRHKRATETYPDGIEADYLMGMLFSIRGNCNPVVAEKHFQSVLNRTPDLAQILNNLAITEVKLRKFDQAYDHWKRALQLDPSNREIIHNVGRAAGQAIPRGGLKMTARRADAYAVLFRKSRDAAGLNDSMLRAGEGWLYSAVVFSSAERAGAGRDSLPAETAPPKANEARDAGPPMVVAGTGSGFAVTSTVVMTNRHVVRNSHLGLVDGVTLQAFAGEDSRKFQGRVRAVSEDHDLALIECLELSAAPITVDDQPLLRGTEVAVFGFPFGEDLGLSLKMTRGIVMSLPEKKHEGMFFLDATANPGNSGGPVCNARGYAVGIVTAITRGRLGDYSLAVPSADARAFLQQANVSVPPAEAGTPERAWKDVDQGVSRSVFLIEAMYRASSLPLASSLPEKIRPARSILEDPSCCSCNGHGIVRCTATGCAFGGSTVYEQYPTTIDLGNGYGKIASITTNVRRKECTVCKGAGRLRCPECQGSGIGADIRR